MGRGKFIPCKPFTCSSVNAEALFNKPLRISPSESNRSINRSTFFFLRSSRESLSALVVVSICTARKKQSESEAKRNIDMIIQSVIINEVINHIYKF